MSKYTIIAAVEAESLMAAWDKVGDLPLNLGPRDLEHSVAEGVRSFKVFASENGAHGCIEWKAEDE